MIFFIIGVLAALVALAVLLLSEEGKAAIALWWLCVGIVLSNLLSVLLQNLTEWIMSLV